MQNLGCELPRIFILRTWVNKEKKKGRGLEKDPDPTKGISCPPCA
jgi:hypothetical protein